MAILNKTKLNKQEIDLKGTGGNAYHLMAVAGSLYKQMERGDEVEALMTEMKSGDYDNLVNVFDREFGSIVDLIR